MAQEELIKSHRISHQNSLIKSSNLHLLSIVSFASLKRMSPSKADKIMASLRTRVSPYPLRSTRSNKQFAYVSPIEAEGPEEWEDVRCVICMEPPHNAVLLHCSSTHKGCRPYICDTSARHSNCYKQFRKNRKKLSCPYCRGEVYETVRISAARRFMNAKPRSCSIEDCEFSGTYSKLNAHSFAEHPDAIAIATKMDLSKQQNWEELEREAQYNELMAAATAGNGQELVDNPMYELRIESIFRSVVTSRIDNHIVNEFGTLSYAARTLLQRRYSIE